MKSSLKLCASVVALLGTAAAAAKDNACLIQGALNSNGIHQTMNVCVANRGLSEPEFRVYCQELFAAHGGGEGGKRADNTVTMKSAASCPASAKASCEGVFGQKLSLLYMADDYAFRQGHAKQFCDTSEGRWKQ